MEVFIISGLIVMAVTVISLVVAVYVMTNQKRRNELSPMISTTATLLGKDVVAKDESERVYVIDVKLRSGKKRSFEVAKKVWMHMHEGDQGILTFKGSDLIDFVIKKSLYHEDKSFFKNNVKTEPVLYFYGEAKELGLSVFSDRKVEIDMLDIEFLLKEIKEDQSDWFFSITTKDHRTLQVERFSKEEVKVTEWIDQKESINITPFNLLI